MNVPVAPIMDFRGRKITAPLKQADRPRLVHARDNFRGRKITAPLKPREGTPERIRAQHFRGRKITAPLKLVIGSMSAFP